MEIKGIGGVYSAYKTTKASTPKKTGAAEAAKKDNTDRVEFGFAAAITAAKAEIVNEINANATPQEIVDAEKFAQSDFSREELAAMILMG